MATKPLPDQRLLLKLLRYEPETGRLFWLERPINMFVGVKRFKPEVKAKQWNARYANKPALNSEHGDGYLGGAVLKHNLFAHRVAWCIWHGEWPADQIDHVNGIRSDNRIANLRAVSRSDNLKNAKLSAINTSGRVGVSQHENGKWVAYIGHEGRKYYLGMFKRFADACQARKAAEIEYNFHRNHGRETMK